MAHAGSRLLSKGDVVEALYDHKGVDKDELTFSVGDKFILLRPPSDESWWYVQSVLKKKDKGYVPSNCVIPENSLDRYEWCHGAINRSAAEFLLVKAETNGAFLVRESQSKPGEYTLSLWDNQVAHYRINQNPDGTCYIRAKQIFNSIPELIAHHQQNYSGLPVVLEHIIPKAGKRAVVISKKTEEAWELKRNDIKMGKMLGAGNYGEVYKAVYHESSKNKLTVAVKTVKEDSMAIDEFMQEAQVMKKMQHPNLVKLIGVCSTEMPMYIVTEFVPNGDMLTYLRRPQSSKEINHEAMLYICTQTSDGMAYLEKHKCIHRDLAARNCLVADELRIKIADFGMGRVIDDLYTARTGSKMPVKWSAPESLCYNAFSSASDVWSFGILLWEVVTLGDNPYPEIESKDVLMRLEEGYRMPEPSNCPPGMYSLMSSCWKMRAEERPSFAWLKESLEQLLDDHKGVERKEFKASTKPKERRESWREDYEKTTEDGMNQMNIQELIDLTKESYGLASTLVRYADQSNVKAQLGNLLSSLAELSTACKPLVQKYSQIKSLMKVINSHMGPLDKMSSKAVLSKVQPHVEKIRNVIRELNKLLKGIKQA